MERYNVNGTEEEQLKQKELAALSIARCKEERQRLRDCFRSSIFGWCSKEQSEFWDCFTEEKDRLKIVVSKIEGEAVPENHWSDDPLPNEDSAPTTSESSSKN